MLNLVKCPILNLLSFDNEPDISLQKLISYWVAKNANDPICCLFSKHHFFSEITVEPVYNGPVLSGHPLLSGQFSKSRFFAHTNAVFVTCIRQPLSGRGHPVAVPCLSFFVIFTCIKRPPLNGN